MLLLMWGFCVVTIIQIKVECCNTLTQPSAVMTTKDKKTDQIRIRISPQLKRRIQQTAAGTDMTMSAWIASVCLRELNAAQGQTDAS